MINRYKEYKLSKFKWFEHVPVNWHEGKISYFFEIGRGRVISELELNPDAPYPVYSSQTKNDGCLGFIDTYDFDDNILTWTTDGANAGTVFIRSGKFNCTNVCGTLKPKVDVDLKYYLYYLQTMTPFYKRPDTNGAKIMNNEMARIYCLIPPIQEQTKIAQYLDHQTAIIDQLIQQKEKLIELLKEKRQAVINESVTKGLKQNVKMKDSGIEWLGEIPENWKSTKLKWITEIYAGGTPSTNIDEFWTNGTIPWLNSGTVNQKRITEASAFITEDAVINSSTKWVPKNSLLMALAGQGKTKGTVAILEFDATCNQSMAAIVPDPKEIKTEFLFFWLHSNYERIRGLAGTEQRDGLNLEIVGNIFCPMPLLEEQKIISKYLVDYDFKSDLVVKDILYQIEKLKEYRQSIISEAVTGKIDVRDWQPNKQQIA